MIDEIPMSLSKCKYLKRLDVNRYSKCKNSNERVYIPSAVIELPNLKILWYS